jgi:hypothetical protein
MADDTTRELLGELLVHSVRKLLERIKTGEATAADLNVARQFLKDNSIDALPTKSNGLKELHSSLPFQTSEEITEEQYH